MSAAQKASVSQLQLDAIEKHERAAEILAVLDPLLLEELKAAPRTSWISPRFMAALLTATYEVGGAELTP